MTVLQTPGLSGPKMPLYLEQVKSGDEAAVLNKAVADSENMQSLINIVGDMDPNDEQALDVMGVAIESVMGQYYNKGLIERPTEESLESSVDGQPSRSARILSAAKEGLKRLIAFIMRMLKAVVEFSKEVFRNSGVRRKLILNRLDQVKKGLKEKDLVLTPIRVPLNQVALVSPYDYIPDSNEDFIALMSRSINAFLDSEYGRKVSEIQRIFEGFEVSSERSNMVRRRLTDLIDLEWFEKDKSVARTDVPPQTALTDFVALLPQRKYVYRFKAKGRYVSGAKGIADRLGYRIEDNPRQYVAPNNEDKVIFDKTDPKELEKDVKQLTEFVQLLGRLMEHVNRVNPSIEKSQKQIERLAKMLEVATGVDPRMQQDLVVFNALVQSILSFPVQLYQNLINYCLAQSSLLSAIVLRKKTNY